MPRIQSSPTATARAVRLQCSDCRRWRLAGVLTLITIKPPLDAFTGAFPNGGYLRCTYPGRGNATRPGTLFPLTRGNQRGDQRRALQGRPSVVGLGPSFGGAYRPPDGLRGT